MQSLYATVRAADGAGPGPFPAEDLFLPEPQTEFIFSIVCEELGFVGAALIVILFALLVWRGFTIGMKAPDKFGSMLAIGLTAQIGVQVVMNMAVVTNIMPNTGISRRFSAMEAPPWSCCWRRWAWCCRYPEASNQKRRREACGRRPPAVEEPLRRGKIPLRGGPKVRLCAIF